jgi:2-polyprenyl-6-methoxyphenol hydroxylase-like FAD-dependent oxidoreductase
MTNVRRVLISGASIAGPALAYELRRNGFEPTLVERAPEPRPGGQAVDVRGKALHVLKRMHLFDKALELKTTLKGVSVVDDEGKETMRSEEMTFSGGRFDANDIEILRDDLSGILLEAVPDVEKIYDNSVSSLTQKDDGVEVVFKDGSRRSFDLVVGADGIHSNIRKLAFGDERSFLHEVGTAIAVFSIPNYLGLEDWQVAHREPNGGYVIYTVRENKEIRVAIGFAARMEDELRGDVAAQKALVAERAAGFGGEIPRILKEMEKATDFYFGVAAQIKMKPWSSGRVVLVGDAAYCPSPLTGQGTSLALVGAYILAKELAQKPDDHAAAFEAYEARMRPFVAFNQALIDTEHQPDAPQRIEKAKNAIVL